MVEAAKGWKDAELCQLCRFTILPETAASWWEAPKTPAADWEAPKTPAADASENGVALSRDRMECFKKWSASDVQTAQGRGVAPT
eukprot:1961143-Karenia_brevis.AAC.1